MESSRTDALGKLLPKSIKEKRRRRKQMQSGSLRNTSSLDVVGDSDGTGSVSNRGEDEEDDRSINDDRSFGSFESGPEPEHSKVPSFTLSASASATASGRASKSSSKSASRTQSRSPSRPAAVSQHPSLIGYLTTSSPEVQAAHIDPQSQAPVNSSRQSSPASSQPLAAQTSNSPVPAEPPPLSLPTAARFASSSGRPRVATTDNTSLPPHTPPNNHDSPAPSIVNTPPSPNEPQSDGRFRNRTVATWQPVNQGSNPDSSPASRKLNTHKRSTSASASIGPSKLSNVTTNPLTPPAESQEASSLEHHNTSFFSSMLSAAQSAANNLSSNVQNSGFSLGPNKGRATPSKSPDPATSRPVSRAAESAAPESSADTMDQNQKDSAVRTLGAGDLSLSALGLDEPISSSAAVTGRKLPDLDTTRARSESAPAGDTPVLGSGEFSSQASTSRPRSLDETTDGDGTPAPSQLEFEDKPTDLSRTGSLKKTHRKRGSSVTTANTIHVGAPLAGVTSPPPPSVANFNAPKLTGFAIASKKRNRDFHSVFKSVPDDDYLIEDYSCALQREILAHGRLYVSEGHLCFSSNILGWTTTVVMSFDEIVSVEKRSTALVFKNGLMVSTLHAKHVFASFTSRDATYDLIVNIWKLGHPTLKSTLNGVQLEGTGGDKTEKIDDEPAAAESTSPEGSGSEEESDDDVEEFYDEGDIEDVAGNDAAEPAGDKEPDKAVSRKVSSLTTANGAAPVPSKEAPPAAGAADFPGPATHAPTECADASSHYEKVVGDEVIPAPLGKVYSFLFGTESASFMTKFLAGDQKCTDVQIDDKRGLSLDNKGRVYSYIKPLNAPIGPRSTKCIITEALDSLDYEKAASLTISTQTPDVPSGNVFVVKTKYCLTWAENNQTRVLVNCTIEWSGKSWIKGTIEKAAGDGQVEHCKSIFALLKSAISSRSRAGTGPNGAAKKKKGKKTKGSQSPLEATETQAPKKAAEQNWGPLEPIRPLLEPLTDLVKPIITGNVMYGLLVGLLVASWFGFGLTRSRAVSPYGPHGAMYSPDRIAAYEEMWRREESELWDWLEERIGLDQLNAEGSNIRKKAMQPRTAEERLREERLDVKEVEEAMRVTEEKLKVMQDAMGRSSHVPEKPGYNDANGI